MESPELPEGYRSDVLTWAECPKEEVKSLCKSFGGSVSVTTAKDDDTWVLVWDEGMVLVGCCSLTVVGKVARLRTDVVHEDHRGKGIYHYMFVRRMRLAMLLKQRRGLTHLDAFSSQDSIREFTKNGFEKCSKVRDDGSGRATWHVKYG